MARDAFRVVAGGPSEPRSELEFELRGAGTSHRVFFRTSEPILAPCNEAFVTCCLLPAMASGVDIGVAGPVSAKLASSLPTIMDILTMWNTDVGRVSWPALEPVEQRRASSGRVGVFFSGGVDSFYTLLKRRDEITDLIFIHGFEKALDDPDLLARAIESVDIVASELGVGVVHVETNLKPVLSEFVDWGRTGHGAGLATVGHLLAPAFERLYVSASFHYRYLPWWGTHPLLDPLWSSEAVEFLHFGCEARRVDKLALIAESDTALDNLRLCGWTPPARFEPGGAMNCGRCEKCLRTMVGLEATGDLERSASFDRPIDLKLQEKLFFIELARHCHEENLASLREHGTRPDLQRAVEKCLRPRPWWHRLERRVRHSIRGIEDPDPRRGW